MEADFGGHLKFRARLGWLAAGSPYTLVSDRVLADGNVEGRLKSEFFLGDRARLDIHYEMILSGGDSRRAANRLAGSLGPSLERFLPAGVPDDDRRLFDLTSEVGSGGDHIFYHRIDRFAVSLTRNWGSLRVGRQAVTWGNGMLFNPMDLFNPFAPTDIERDYKMGDDMISLQMPVGNSSDMHLLYVPRRDPESRKMGWDQTSLAAKYHFFMGAAEFDIMAARHYEDTVFGAGAVGYLGEAAWRVNAVYTDVESDCHGDDYLSLVANMDYSWVLWGKNFYGFIEFFHGGIGKDDPTEAIESPVIAERIDRGELFTLGKNYIATSLRLEIHPLVNFFVTGIANLHDTSGLLQPRLTHDISQNVQILMGGNFFWGESGSEFGGFPIPGTPFINQRPQTVFLWVSHYF